MAFLREEEQREPAFRVPASVAGLIAALVLAHIVRVFLPPDAAERVLVHYGFIPLRYAYGSAGAGGFLDQVLPFVSYLFVHGDITHIAMNCLWLLAFGPIVAKRFGTVLFLLFFLVCGVAAAAAYLALNRMSPAAMIGASGAISGLMAAAIRMLPFPARQQDVGGDLVPILSRPVVVFSLLWIAVNLAFGPAGLTIGGETSPLAWQAHLGGYFAGLFLAGPFDLVTRRVAPNEPPPA
jgi:membrane associated rhomboid family serine protease